MSQARTLPRLDEIGMRKAIEEAQQSLSLQLAMQKITRSCSGVCVTPSQRAPVDALTSRQTTCMQNCTARYLDNVSFVMARLVRHEELQMQQQAQLQQQQQQHQMHQ